MDTSRQSSNSNHKELVEILSGNFKEVSLNRRGQRVYMPIAQNKFVGPMIVEDHKTALLKCPETGREFHYLGRLYAKSNRN